MSKPISDAKLRLSIPNLMRQLGIPPESIPKNKALHGRAQSVRCPWFNHHSHEDKKPSCSIYANGTRIHCFVCDYNLDGPGFLQRWKNIPQAQAIRDFIHSAQGWPMSGLPVKRMAPKVVVVELSPLSDWDREHIARSRVIDVTAVRWACELGVLHFSSVCGYRSWVLTDGSKRIAEARRLDGQNYPEWENVGERKAHTIKGSEKSWALGAELLHRHADVRAIMLVEGGPDYLAALHWIYSFQRTDILPVAMLGKAGMHPDALQLLKGRRMRIYPHNDPDGGGLKAASQWAAQLRHVGCEVDLFQFDGLYRTNGQPVKDLNDLTTIDQQLVQNPSQLQKLQFLLP
jgi:hypothetical protein